jgi:hypothetical protein
MTAAVSIEQALASPQLLGAALGDLSTWSTWFAVIKAAYGRKLTAVERAGFAKVAGLRSPPRRKVKELVAKISRRAGKGRAGGAMMVHEAVLVDHSAHLAPGETGVCAAISPTRAQATILLNYARGFLESSPLLRGEVHEITNDEIRLRNGNVICTLAADFRSLRGRTLLFALLDEAAFLRDDRSATPDVEAARALLPGLMTTGGMLAIMSSPYQQRGLLHQRHRDFFGKDDADVLVVAGASTDFNPTLDAEKIEAARAADPQAAMAEWFGEFRNDLAQFLEDALIDAAIDADRPLEIAPRAGHTYVAGVDMSGGRHDASCLCIAHAEGEGETRRYVADVVRGHRAPHDPATVVREFADLCKQYRTSPTGDNYGAEWIVAAFREAGVDYRRSELTRSELYLEGLPLWARGLVRIPDHPALTRELRLLERRTTRSGKDSVDHGAGGADDHANSLFATLHQLSAETSADGWIRYYGDQAKRAHAPENAPSAPKENVRPWQTPSQVVDQARKEGNELTEIYTKIRLGIERVHLATCAACGVELRGHRVTDGHYGWCSASCERTWHAGKRAAA